MNGFQWINNKIEGSVHFEAFRWNLKSKGVFPANPRQKFGVLQQMAFSPCRVPGKSVLLLLLLLLLASNKLKMSWLKMKWLILLKTKCSNALSSLTKLYATTVAFHSANRRSAIVMSIWKSSADSFSFAHVYQSFPCKRRRKFPAAFLSVLC